MIIQTFKMQFQCVMWITRHSSIWIAKKTAFTAVFQPNYENLQKVGHDIVIFSGNVLGHAWQTWCKKGTNGKRMSSSLLICHMQIFKSIDFRTMGLWIWITFFFDTHCTDSDTYANRLTVLLIFQFSGTKMSLTMCLDPARTSNSSMHPTNSLSSSHQGAGPVTREAVTMAATATTSRAVEDATHTTEARSPARKRSSRVCNFSLWRSVHVISIH